MRTIHSQIVARAVSRDGADRRPPMRRRIWESSRGVPAGHCPHLRHSDPNPGIADGGGTLVTNNAAREADHDRRQCGPPRPVRHVSIGLGGGRKEVAFTSNRGDNADIFLRQADGSGEEQVLAATPSRETLSDWSRDGKYLLYHLADPETGADLWYLERNEDGSGWEPYYEWR